MIAGSSGMDWSNNCIHHHLGDDKIHWCNCNDFYYPTPGINCPFKDDGRHARSICKFYRECMIKDLGRDIYKIVIDNKEVDYKFTKLELMILFDILTEWLAKKP